MRNVFSGVIVLLVSVSLFSCNQEASIAGDYLLDNLGQNMAQGSPERAHFYATFQASEGSQVLDDRQVIRGSYLNLMEDGTYAMLAHLHFEHGTYTATEGEGNTTINLTPQGGEPSMVLLNAEQTSITWSYGKGPKLTFRVKKLENPLSYHTAAMNQWRSSADMPMKTRVRGHLNYLVAMFEDATTNTEFQLQPNDPCHCTAFKFSSRGMGLTRGKSSDNARCFYDLFEEGEPEKVADDLTIGFSQARSHGYNMENGKYEYFFKYLKSVRASLPN